MKHTGYRRSYDISIFTIHKTKDRIFKCGQKNVIFLSTRYYVNLGITCWSHLKQLSVDSVEDSLKLHHNIQHWQWSQFNSPDKNIFTISRMSHSQLTYFKVGHNTSCFKIMLKALNPKKNYFGSMGNSLFGDMLQRILLSLAFKEKVNCR